MSKSENLNIHWQWIAGVQNPADLISRGTSVEELKDDKIWWHGPEWLLLYANHWPCQPEVPNCNSQQDFLNEFRTIHLTMKSQELIRGKWFKFDLSKQLNFSLLDCYGDWKRLLRVTTTIFRAVHNFKNFKDKRFDSFDTSEYANARKFLLKMDQNRTFPEAIEAAKRNEKGILSKLVVQWDQASELLRIDGRIRSENLTKDEQFPILLSKNGILAKLLMRNAHDLLKHGGTQQILQYLRQHYWIIGARILAKSILRQCPTCFRFRMKTSEQLMATLPTVRTTPKRAFSKTGVDYAGPVIIRSALGRFPKLTKAWIAVFVCLVTRAIHLELVSDASTQAFIAALRRLIARRGTITEIISDNGTNFVGANNYIKAILQQINQNSKQFEEEFNLKWTFATPNAPHHGGIYEAAVKSTKHHLVRVIGNTSLTFEEYATVLCQVEACVNSRPLSPLNDDQTSLNALTPGHFLIGEELVRMPDESDFREVNENRLNRWNHLQQMTQHFWDRWKDELFIESNQSK